MAAEAMQNASQMQAKCKPHVYNLPTLYSHDVDISKLKSSPTAVIPPNLCLSLSRNSANIFHNAFCKHSIHSVNILRTFSELFPDNKAKQQSNHSHFASHPLSLQHQISSHIFIQHLHTHVLV